MDFQGLTTSLTFDTKYRDQLTVEEVRARTRDALDPVRSLQVGKYSNTIQDMIVPVELPGRLRDHPDPGQGVLPEDAARDTPVPLRGVDQEAPAEEPAPSAPWYIRIGKTDTTTDKNWSGVIRDGRDMAIPIRMGQAGSIRLTQIAAYDKPATCMPVKFHFSIYAATGSAADGMPNFPHDRVGSPRPTRLRTPNDPD